MTTPKARKPVARKKPAAKKSAAKRAPRKAEPKKLPTPAQAKLDAYGITQVCADITDGKSMTEIATTVRVSFGSLATWLEASTERSARAREARQLAARKWDEEALAGIERAKDKFTLDKAKEAAHHLRWRASKIAPREYGDKLGLGAAPDLPPLPSAPAATVNVSVTPADAYAQMLARKG